MTRHAHLLAALLLLAGLAPTAGATDAGVAQAPRLDLGPVGADAILGFPLLARDVDGGARAVALAQLEQQGLLAPGATRLLLAEALEADAGASEGAAARKPPPKPRPPAHVYRDVHPVCDLDGDGVRDALSNDLTLLSPPGTARADSRLQAISGADGSVLWTVDNLMYVRQDVPSDVPSARGGDPLPRAGENMAPTLDGDGDGVCDLVTFGFEYGTGISTPIVGDPSLFQFHTTLRLVSGKDGSDLWTRPIDGSVASVSTPLISPVQAQLIRDMPSGMLVYNASDGPRLAFKTTDVDYVLAEDPFQFVHRVSILRMTPYLLKGPLRYESLTVNERVLSIDVKSGETRWTRELASGGDARFTNLSWFSGAADLDGDGEPEVVLDQLTVANPRGTEANHPVSGKTLFEYGRGMRVTALDGATGETDWMATVLDPLAVRVNPGQEENHEVLAFTRAKVMPDLDGDAKPDVLASYVVQEQNLAATIEGAYRTHFVPVAGANGSLLWDVRQQGWGFAQPLDVPATRLGLGMVDVPTAPPEGGRWPPKFVRLVVLDAKDGAVQWSYERSFTQNSYLSYNLALGQYQTTLAPHDWDADGLLDLVTPSQYGPITGRDQVLLASSGHTYDVKSGADGSVLRTITAWGPDGRVVDCPGAPGTITVITGHARRLDLTRFDADGAQAWRRPLWNDPAPRAATTAIDLTALGTACTETAPGRTLYAVNMQAFSWERRHEVIALRGVLDAGAPRWQEPEVMGEPSTDILLLTTAPIEEETTPAFPWIPLLVGAVLGLATGALLLTLLARTGLGRLVGVGLVLLLLLVPTLTPAAALPGQALPSRGLPNAAPPNAALPGGALPDAAGAGLAAPNAPGLPPSLGAAAGDAPATGIAGSAAPGPALHEGEGARVAGAQARLVADLVGLGEGWTPQEHMRLVQRFLHESGYRVPPPPSNETSLFDPNHTISFSYALGDVDGDGHDDLALDQYCIDFFACDASPPFNQDPVGALTGFTCDYSHQLNAHSGRTGERIWSVDLSMRGLFTECGLAFVLGAIPTDNGTGFLVYEYSIGLFGIGAVELQHAFSLVDGATGETRWTYAQPGILVRDFVSFNAARDLVIVPVVARATQAEHALFAQPPAPALFLQGVGFADAVVTTALAAPGFDRAIAVLDQYAPIEWAARIDLATGEPAWRVDTFRPVPGRNVLPQAMDDPVSLGYPIGDPWDRYWERGACCFDLTGDGEPDLLFRVYEWTATPSANVNGPYGIDSRLVAYSGADGSLAFDAQVAKDLQVPLGPDRHPLSTLMGGTVAAPRYDLRVQPLGDVDGDGAHDVLLHEYLYHDQFTQAITARSGRDGSELWRIDSPREVKALVIGDSDRDGAADLLLLRWFSFETGGRFVDEFVTPAATPLVVHSGRTGAELWRATTWQAPVDVVTTFDTLRRNGGPDVDGDGVSDLVVDDPLYLGDQTVIHRLRVLRGTDGAELYGIRTVGTFAVPARVPDLTGDGLDELAVLSGDVNDLWVTLHEGADGAALWSRRLAAVPASGYAFALPKLQFHALDGPDGRRDLVVDMHLDLVTAAFFTGIFVNGEGATAGESFGFYTYTSPQLLRVDGQRGRLAWAYPPLDADVLETSIVGATPGAKAYDELTRLATEKAAAEARAAIPIVIPGGFGFLLAFILVTGVGVPILRARRRDQEVPDLD